MSLTESDKVVMCRCQGLRAGSTTSPNVPPPTPLTAADPSCLSFGTMAHHRPFGRSECVRSCARGNETRPLPEVDETAARGRTPVRRRQIPSRFRPTSPPRTARCRGGGFDRCDGPQPHSRHPVTRAPCPNASVTAHGRPDQPHVLDQSRDTNVRLVSARGSLNGRLEGGRSRLPDDL